jgi:integrase
MLRIKNGLPKYCCRNTDQHGRQRVRFRKGAFSTYLIGIPWSEDFMRQYASALEGVQAQTANIGIERTKAGSFNALVVSYYRSPEFRGLKPSSQKMRQRIIETFRKEHGDAPINRLTRAHIKEIIGAKSHIPEAANNLLRILRVLLNYAVSIDMIEANPSIGVKLYRSKNPDGIHTWIEEEVTQFVARHPVGTMARLAMMLMLCTGQRKSDAVRMGWQHVRNGKITVRQEKTNTPLLIPIHPDLEQALTATPRTNLTFVVTGRGNPFTPAGFGNWFRDRCNEAGLPQCSAHGLRKLAATRLADAGCSDWEVASITGHKSMSQVAHYTRAANQSRLADQAIAKQRTNRDEKLSNLPTRLDKTGSK